MLNIVAIKRNVDVTRRERSGSPGGQRPGPRGQARRHPDPRPGRRRDARAATWTGRMKNRHRPGARWLAPGHVSRV